MIPEVAVEAAADKVYRIVTGRSWTSANYMERADAETTARWILEAAAPHLLASVLATLDEHVTALENTLVDECDYPALCAQREAPVGVIQMLQVPK